MSNMAACSLGCGLVAPSSSAGRRGQRRGARNTSEASLLLRARHLGVSTPWLVATRVRGISRAGVASRGGPRARGRVAATSSAAMAAQEEKAPQSPIVSFAVSLLAFAGLAVWRYMQAGASGLVGIALSVALAIYLGYNLAAYTEFKEKESKQALVLENIALTTRLEELQSVLASAPLDISVEAEPGVDPSLLKVEFVPGIDKKGVETKVDQMLLREDVNIGWLPDVIERQLYINVITLILGVVDQTISSMSINVVGHRMSMSISHLAKK